MRARALAMLVLALCTGLAAAQQLDRPPGKRRGGGRGKRLGRRKGRGKRRNWQARLKESLHKSLIQPYLMTRNYFPDATREAIMSRNPQLWRAFNGEHVTLRRPEVQQAVQKLRTLSNELEQAAATQPNASGIEMLQQLFQRESSTYGEAKLKASPLYVAIEGQAPKPTERAAERLFESKWMHMSGCSTMRQLHESLQKGLSFNGTLSSKNDTCWASPRWQVQRDYNFLLACRTFSTAYDATHDGLRSRMSFSWKDAMFGWGDAHVFSQWATRLPDVLVLVQRRAQAAQ